MMRRERRWNGVKGGKCEERRGEERRVEERRGEKWSSDERWKGGAEGRRG